MAVLVSDTRTIFDLAQTTTDWTGAGGTSTAVFAQGGVSVVATLNITTGQVYHTGAAAVDLSDTLIYVWSNNFAQQGAWDAAQPANALHLGDGTDRISFKMAGNNRKVFAHLDAGVGVPVDWDCLVLDGSQASAMNTAGLTVARAGSFAGLNLAAITQIGSDFTTESKGLGGGINVAVDVIRYGNGGLIINGGTTGDRGKFSEIVLADRDTGSAFGIIRELATGLYSAQGPLTFGSVTEKSDVWFEDSGRVLLFENRNISNDKYFIRVQGEPTIDNNFILRNSTITTAGPFVRCEFNGGNVNTLTLTGNTFVGLGNAVTFSNLADASGHTVTGNVFNGCGRIDPGDVIFSDNTISNSTDAGGALLVDADGTANISDIRFISGGSGHAILITAPGTYDFTGITYTGYGLAGTTDAAVYNNSGGAVTINVAGGGDAPTVRNGAGATTTVNANIQITLTGLKTNTEVRVYADSSGDNGTELAGVESSGTSFAFTVQASTIINIMINNLNYLPADIWQLNAGAVDREIPISQVVDRQYFNP